MTRQRFSPADTVRGDFSMYVVRSLRGTSRGGIVLDVGGQAFDGYQTRDGIALGTTGRDKDGDHFILRAVGTTVEFRPSFNSGTFDVSLASNWYSKEETRSSSPTNWNGSAAIVVLNDSAFVDMVLRNDTGGTTAFTATGPIDGTGAFSLATSIGSTLVGTLRAGLLSAEFRDQRDDGSSFRGTLRAVRK